MDAQGKMVLFVGVGGGMGMQRRLGLPPVKDRRVCPKNIAHS